MANRLRSPLRRAVRWMATGVGFAAGAYATYAGVTWYRYGRPRPGRGEDADALLDRFMPFYEVVERQHIRVGAPADVTLAAAKEMDLLNLPIARAIFGARELMLGAELAPRPLSRGLMSELTAIGWRVLEEIPGREVVVGAATKPWEPNPTFRGLPPDAFAAFDEPGYVKIAWTLRADPDGPDRSVFRTETRAAATDPTARRRFRRYWSWLSPGIILIRRASLGPLRRDAERRVADLSRS